MLNRRLISAGVIIPVMIALIVFDHWLGRADGFNRPGMVISAITILGAIFAGGELLDLWRKGGTPPISFRWTLLAIGLMAFGCCLPMLSPAISTQLHLGKLGGASVGISAALIMVFIRGLLERKLSGPGRTDAISRSVLAIGYFFLLVAFLPAHRLLQDENGSGLCALLLVIVTVKMSDSWAYAFGKSFGKTRMAPALSPNKTVEGAVGAVLGSIFGASIIGLVVAPQVASESFPSQFAWIAGYGVFVCLAGMAGDLFESLLKRDTHSKDSSAWIPGLGGVLDVLDSLVVAAPASWLYFALTGRL